MINTFQKSSLGNMDITTYFKKIKQIFCNMLLF